MKYFFLLPLLLVMFLGSAVDVLAAPSPSTPGYLIVCDPKPDPTGPNAGLSDCHFDDLIRLGVNIINFLIVLSTALAAVAIAYAGFLLLSSGGNSSKRTQAKDILTKVAIGLFFIIAGWLIVNQIIVALLDPNQPGLFILRP